MFEKNECLKARSKISALSNIGENLVAFSTKTHGIKIFSSETCRPTQNVLVEQLNYKTTAVAFSGKSRLFAFAHTNIIYIMNIDSKIIIQTIRTNEGSIVMMEFVPNSLYLVTGTQNGRVMQYRHDGRFGLSRLCSFGHNTSSTEQKIKNNYVSAFASKGALLAFSGYGGIITILKMHSHAIKNSIEASKVRINILCFLNEEKIVSGNINGLIQIHSLKKYQKTVKINTPFVDVQQIILMPNPRYIMVSGKSKSLIIIDTLQEKVVSNNYLSFKENVSKISLTQDKNLLVVLENNSVIKVTLPTSGDLKSFILHNELDKAYLILDADPMFEGSREKKRVDIMFERACNRAIDALMVSNTKEARLMLRMFNNIQSKKDAVDSIFKAFELFPRFKTLFHNNKYPVMYAMAEKYPALKYTTHYKKMQEGFKEAFSFAQKQLLMNKRDIAKEVLSLYLGTVSKKSILDLVVHENIDFSLFLKAMKDGNTKKMDFLIGKNKLFAEIPTYQKQKDLTKDFLNSIRLSIDAGKTLNAVEKIKKLMHNEDIKDELLELYKETKIVAKLQKSYDENDFKKCYEILDEDIYLYNLELSKFLENHWTKLMNECEEYALKGDLKSIKKSLGDLIAVETRLQKIGDLIRLSFQIKIKALLGKSSFNNAESVIYSYIDTFGLDSEIRLIMRSFERVSKHKLAITSDQEKDVPRDGWLSSSLIMQN